MFPFPTFVPAVSGSAVAVSYLTTASDTSDQTTYNGVSFQGLTFGAADAARYIVVGIGARANSARSISSVTIGGVAATHVCTANDTSAGADIASLYIAAVPTGTTGDVVVTFSGAMLRCQIGLWRMTGISSATPNATMTDNTISAGVLTGTINCPANGAIIGAAWGAGSGSQTATWAGITEVYDGQPETTSNNATGAHATFFAAQTGLTVSATIGGTSPSSGGLAVASWGP